MLLLQIINLLHHLSCVSKAAKLSYKYNNYDHSGYTAATVNFSKANSANRQEGRASSVSAKVLCSLNFIKI